MLVDARLLAERQVLVCTSTKQSAQYRHYVFIAIFSPGFSMVKIDFEKKKKGEKMIRNKGTDRNARE